MVNRTFNKIKIFFNQKPVRIIVALLVIAAIMTGISFAIIALLHSISDKCANQPGKEWNKDLQMCVLRQCPDDGNLCLTKGLKAGNCIPKDYCKEYEGAQYRYDRDTCECTIDCSGSEEEPFTKNGHKSTKFENGKPTDPLTCGIKCNYNIKFSEDTAGGYKWCPSEGYWCGQFIYKENDNAAPGQGCWEKSRFHNCSEDIVCPKGVACVSNSEGEPRCMPSLCSGEENNEELVYACLNDDDCINPYKSDINVNDAKCITGELASNDEDKKFTHFKQVGYCSKTNRFKDNNCTIKRLIGETSASTTDNTPTIKICKNINSSVEGISTFNPQCENVAENGCAKFGICPNEWQGKSGPDIKHCVSENESIEEARKEMEYYCCDNPAVTPSGNKFCCPYKTFSDPEFGDQLCTLNTKFGYSKKHLDNTASLSETLSCSVDENCTKFNKDFYKVLGITQSEAEDKTNNNFSSLYCDKNDNVCKAFCGFYDATSQLEDNFGKIDISIGSLSEEEQYSFCFPKDSCEIAWQKVKDGIYLPNGYPVCEKTEGETMSYKWSGNYGDGYTFKAESSLIGDCIDKVSSINTCMNALGKSNYHINDVTVTPDGKCGFSAVCDQLELTTDKGPVSWTSLKEPSWANLNKIEFTGTPQTATQPAQPGIGLISQTSNSKNMQTGIQNYATVSNGNCIGIINSFSEDITINPFEYVLDVKSCDLNKSKISKLKHTGEYCMNGVNPLSPPGACLDNPLDCTKENRYINIKENFGNIDITKNNKKTNTLSSAPSPPALPKNKIFGLVYNQTTDENKKNKQATIQDSYANKFSCGDMKLNNDGATQKNLETELTRTPVHITCKDDECGHGNIKCFDTGGQPTACCGSYGATNPYAINFDSQTGIYSCAGGKGVGYKAQSFPEYNCVLTQDDWNFTNTPDGEIACLNSLKPGGYYCNGPNAPGTIMDPYGETNGVLNINTNTGMKGITGCKWTDNAYFYDDSNPDWSQDNVSLAQCNILCSQQLEGERDKNFLDFSTRSEYIETGKICGWAPSGNQDDKGLCSIKTGVTVIKNNSEGSSNNGRKLTKCNDIFKTAGEVTPEVCGFNACRGVAGPGYSNQFGGVAGNCIENGGHCSGCPGSCVQWNQCDQGECCQGCGDDGSHCPGNPPCCGTGYGDGDGAYGCGFCQDGPKCKDNNTYPCYWAGWRDERTRDVRKLWDRANHSIA